MLENPGPEVFGLAGGKAGPLLGATQLHGDRSASALRPPCPSGVTACAFPHARLNPGFMGHVADALRNVAKL